MNDIQLTKYGDYWDWKFDSRGVVNVKGVQQIINAVKHAVMLREGELEPEIYLNKGLPEVVMQNTSQNGQKFVIDTINNEVQKIEGIQSATTEITRVGLQTKIKITIITNEGLMVTV